MSGSVFTIFFSVVFVAGVKKTHCFLQVDFIFCHTAKIDGWSFLAFWQIFLEAHVYSIILPAKRDSWIPLPVVIPLISFSCLVTSANTLCLILKMNRGSGHSLVSFLISVKLLQIFFHIDAVGCGLFIYSFYCIEICSLQSYSFQDFYHEGMLGFVKGFSMSIEMFM